MRSTTLPVTVSFALYAASIFSHIRRRSTFWYDKITYPSLCSPVRCTSIVVFGSGLGMSVSENSTAGISPSDFCPMSTTTPCSVYATTFTSIISFCAAPSCGSLYCSISLLISSEPAASSAAAAASGSSAAVPAWASLPCPSCPPAGAAGAVACSGRGSPSACGTGAAGASSLAAFTAATVSLASACVACASFAAGFSVLSDSVAGAAAADEDGLSWSGNMVDGLREDNFSSGPQPSRVHLSIR